ncbi:unnamed protein product [Rhizophagus irregularis]|nr:unnamed protein product [Rhizophagus irregularis]
MALQLAHAVLCLHDEGIVHRDLHSKNISQGLRETPIPDTPTTYVDLYTECWNGEPDKRPTIKQMVDKLKVLNNNHNNVIM